MIAALLALVPCQDARPVHPDLADCGARWQQALEEFGASALAMVLVEGDEVVHLATFGRRDPERDLPVTPDTVFYIASATKPYVAFALAQLAEEGLVDLDAPVKRYLPRFELADARLSSELTVRDLLCHRFGLDSGPIVLLDAYTGEITEERYYHFLKEVEPAGAVAYSNVHFTLAGRVIEAVTGKSWRDALAERLFTPAGMTRTSGYASWMYAQEDVALPALFAGGRPVRAPVQKSDRTMHAAGGLGTSILDLSRWLRIQLGRGRLGQTRLLGEDPFEAMLALQSSAKESDEFGHVEGFALGWQRGSYRGQLELRHGGGYIGCASQVCFLPELGMGLAILATGDIGAQGLLRLVSTDVHERLLADDEVHDPLEALRERVRSERERSARRSASESTTVGAPPALQLSLPPASYAGTYRNEFFGTFTVECGGELSARLGDLALELSTPEPDGIRVASAQALEAQGKFEIAEGRAVAVELVLMGDARARFTR